MRLDDISKGPTVNRREKVWAWPLRPSNLEKSGGKKCSQPRIISDQLEAAKELRRRKIK